MTEKEQVIYQLRAAGKSVKGSMSLQAMSELYDVVYVETREKIDGLIKEQYNKLLRSGMFWEFHPELTGVWEKDEAEFKKISKK